MAGSRIPGHGQCLAGELEWDGAADRGGCPVAGLPGAEDLLGVFYRDFNRPSGGVALDDLRGGRGGIGGDQGEVIPGGGAVADQYDLDAAGAEDGVPQAGDRGGLDGGGLAVAGDGDRGEVRGGGEPSQGRQPVAAGAGPAPLAGALRRQSVSFATARPRSPAFQRARAKKKCARSWLHACDRPAPASMPHTVRFPVCAKNPQARPQNVRNDGAVNNGAKPVSSVISDAGTGSVASGSIGGNPFHRRFPSTADASLFTPSPVMSPDHMACRDHPSVAARPTAPRCHQAAHGPRTQRCRAVSRCICDSFSGLRTA